MINQFYIDYIKAIENPDRVGWNGKVWTAPQYKGYDKNQRGYGIDIVKNDSAKRLTQNRPGQWLTEEEADKLMKEHLLYVYSAALKHIEGFDNLSDKRKAALLGMLYRGDSVNKNRHIININEPDDNKFFESISNYYKSKGLNERAKNSNNFFSNNQLTNFLIPMKWEQWKPSMKFKEGGLIRKMQTAAGGPIHYSRTMTTDNMSRAANYVGGYVLKGLGAFGKFLNAGFTSPTYGTMGQVSYARNAEDAKRQRELSEASEQALGKAMTWVSPLNYGVALATGNGLNAKKGEEEVASWSPAWLATARLGELYVGPKGVKAVKSAPRVVVNTAAKAGVKPARAAVVAKEINKGIKQNTRNGKIEVTEDYFNSPDKWYRVSERPEKIGIELNGKNVTTSDDPGINGTINGWRESMLSLTGRIIPGKGIDEGYFIFLPRKISLSKHGAAHGNTSQAAKGLIWLGTFAFSDKFPIGVIEGLAPVKIFRGMNNLGKDSRTNFVLLNWEDVPLGARVGFHTGEMPMSNLGWFLKTKNGTYTYEPIISEKRITYLPILLLDSPTSLKFFERPTLSNTQELAGITKWERNFKPKWHVANYPGYLLKGLMKGSLLEKQLSKNGTININQLNAYFNKASQLEREVVNKVLAEKFAGLKTIDYNLFKKAVLNELITYERVPLTKYAKYGMDRLGFTDKVEGLFEEGPLVLAGIPQNVPLQEPLPGIKINTFTFESPRISVGSNKHYDTTTLGHSRTYTTPDEPNVLHVMESLSDWGQSHVKMMPSVLAHQIAIEKALKSGNINAFHSFTNRLSSLMRDKLTKYERMALENINKEIEYGLPSGFLTIEDLWNKKYEILKRAGNRSNIGVLGLHLHDNYLLRQLQENLRYAAENGYTKMRYPTSETAAKIEGYLKVNHTLLNELSNLQMKLGELFENGEISYEEYDKMIDAINKLKKELFGKEYDPKHLTILKKYEDFPKLFLKLFKGQQVRIVTDAKGNTWYEVDVPKGYLSREWLFKQGGKMNVIEQFKQGGQVRKMLTASGGPIINGGTPFSITVKGKDRRPAWKRMYLNPNLGDTSKYYNGNILEGIIGLTPGVGDAIDAVKAADAVNNKDYTTAGFLGAGLLLPNIIEKPLKFARGLYKGYKANKTMKAAKKAFDESGEKLEVDAFKSGSKPMYVTPAKGPGSDHINAISDELKDSKYFDLERPFGKDETLTLRYYINEDKLKQTIETYKDFYKDRLGLYTNDVDKIYNHIISNPKLLDLDINSGTTGLLDIIGVSLGYGPKDAILFKIGYSGLNRGEKVSKDAIESMKVYGYDRTLPGIYNILKKNIERGTLGVKSTDTNGGHVGFGYVKNKLGGMLQLLKNGNKIKKALLGTNLNVDTRSDTTRQGYNERGMSSVLSHNYFPLLDFYNAVEEISLTSNNPYLNTGIVYTPSRADRTWKFLHDFVKKNPRVLSNPTVVSKGMIPGNEITVGQVKQPLTGLTIRNNTPLTLENTVMNPAEKAAAEDYLASRNLKNFEEFPDVTINTKLPTGRPTGDYKYPKEIMEKYGFGKPKVTQQQLTTKPVSKTSSQRSKEYYSKKKEDKDNGVSRKRSRLVLNNKALTTGDMRSANTGRPRKAARNIDLEAELKKDNGYWGREFNKIKLKVALGKQGSELKYKDFLDSYWNYKLKGILGKEKFGGILNFYKNGSGIHIKEKNKGSFTRWCGGNVTEECIRRGKASSNPKIRKKATFADNARHFKHRLGGNVIKEFKSKRAFHPGVDISDSNPNAYKYVKKKYKMHSFGGDITINHSPIEYMHDYWKQQVELLRELKKQKELLEAQKLELENLKTNNLLDMLSGIVQNKDWIVDLFNKNKKPSISMNGSSIITGKPDSSNKVITTESGMNGTIDLWRKAIQG